MKKISIYCFILISLGFIGCTSKTHEKTIEDFDIREMSLQVDTLYSRMTQAERVAQLYGIRPKEIMEDGKLSLENSLRYTSHISRRGHYRTGCQRSDRLSPTIGYSLHMESGTGYSKNGTNGGSHALCWRYSCFVTHGRSHTYRSLATYRRILW